MSRLELEYEIQCKIISAAVRLSKEKGIDKSIKKERLQAAQRAQVNKIPRFPNVSQELSTTVKHRCDDFRK